MNPKIILIALIAILVAAFFVFDLQQYFNLEYLKQQKDSLNQLFVERPVLVSIGFFALYVLVAALALPAAALLTIAGGAIFGFWHGLLLISFASSIGATIAFLLTRYLFHEGVEQKFGSKLETINSGIEREGAFYVFGLRFVPFFPFVAVNSLLALTKLDVWTFYWASQIGMLVGTAVYVNAGTQLATISNTSDILSPTLLFSFALLGVLPIAAKWILDALRKRKQST